MTTKTGATWIVAICLIALAIGFLGGRFTAPGPAVRPVPSTPIDRGTDRTLAVARDLQDLRAASAKEKAVLEAKVSGLEAEIASTKRSPDTPPDAEPETKSLEDRLLDLVIQKLDLEQIWKTVHDAGDLDGMELYLEIAQVIYELRLAQPGLTPQERKRLEQSIDFIGFRKGYTHLARGDAAQARDDLQAHLEALDQKERALEASGESLPAASQVYRQRSKDVLEAIDALIGRPPAVEIDLGENWLTAKRSSLAELRGKAAGIVFRSPNDRRSGDFLGRLSQLTAKQSSIEIVSISYSSGNRSTEDQATELRQELDGIGFQGAAGLDGDSASHSMFKGFRAMIGTATFYILDPSGKIVWFQQDPHGTDVLFALKLLQRAAGI